MIRAFILIVTTPGLTAGIVRQLADIPSIAEAHEVMGPYDIVAELIVPELADIPPILTGRVRALHGVTSTTTLVAFADE